MKHMFVGQGSSAELAEGMEERISQGATDCFPFSPLQISTLGMIQMDSNIHKQQNNEKENAHVASACRTSL